MKNTTQTRLLIACLVILPVFSGCSSLSVDSEWDHQVDFSGYQSYAWIPQDEGPVNEQQLPKHLDLRLRRVVDEILIDEKGLERAPTPAQADFLLAYYINTKKETKVNYSVYAGYYGGYGYGGYGYGYWPGYHGGMGISGGTAMHNVREYTTGTLVLDIVDPKTHAMIWTGVVAGEARYESPTGERVTDIVTEMLMSFPPSDAK